VVTLGRTIPAMPVREAGAAVDFYRDRLGVTFFERVGA
jgi:hypothetical protein